MLAPKRQKYRKMFRGKMGGVAVAGSSLNFGDYGLKATDRGWLSAAQIEAARKAITHYTKRGGKVWIRVFPDKPISGKSAGVRMGGGKGDVQKYVAVIRPGRVIFEIAGVMEIDAKTAFTLAAAKLPFTTRFITKK